MMLRKETTGRNGISGDSAISESIGFVLIFSLVLIGISLVTLYGYPVLLNQQKSTNQQIMQKNMIVLQNDLKELTYKTVPYKETSLSVGGGSLAIINSSLSQQSFNITYGGTSCGTGGTLVNYYPIAGQLGELRYISDDQGLVTTIENGAVIYRQFGTSGSAMLANPRWFYDAPTQTAVIYMINMSSSQYFSRTGVSTVQMQLVNTSYSTFTISPTQVFCVGYKPNGDPNQNEDYSTAWRDYITKTLGWTETPAGSGIYQVPSGATGTTTLVIKEYDVVVTSL